MQRCGYVAIVGKPNVGKSTLLNHVLGRKISITTRRPHTTRCRILGIKTQEEVQAVYLDTPGFASDTAFPLQPYLKSAVVGAVSDADLVVFMVQRLQWDKNDIHIMRRFCSAKPMILAVNKIDQVAEERLPPHLEFLDQQGDFAAILPLCARRVRYVARLEALVARHLPAGEHLYPAEQLTDLDERLQATELVREKLLRQLGDELPYRAAVDIERWEQRSDSLHLDVAILVERASQKAIVIGHRGSRLQRIGIQSRRDLEQLCGVAVVLRLWVRVRKNWHRDPLVLRRLGYGRG